jgi:hypothetical protein
MNETCKNIGTLLKDQTFELWEQRKEGKEVQAKSIGNIFNRVIVEKFLYFKKRDILLATGVL